MSSTIIYLKALKRLISMPLMSLNSFFQANKISPVTRLQEMGSEGSTGKDPLPPRLLMAGSFQLFKSQLKKHQLRAASLTAPPSVLLFCLLHTTYYHPKHPVQYL